MCVRESLPEEDERRMRVRRLKEDDSPYGHESGAERKKGGGGWIDMQNG